MESQRQKFSHHQSQIRCFGELVNSFTLRRCGGLASAGMNTRCIRCISIFSQEICHLITIFYPDDSVIADDCAVLKTAFSFFGACVVLPVRIARTILAILVMLERPRAYLPAVDTTGEQLRPATLFKLCNQRLNLCQSQADIVLSKCQ